MIQKKSIVVCGMSIIVLSTTYLSAQRSIYRPAQEKLPTITTRWLGKKNYYSSRNSHYEEFPIFKVFNADDFKKDMLPTGIIHERANPERTITGNTISELIEQLIIEVQQKKRQYTDFFILSKKNFNRAKACGLLIVKCKNYPFIVKLFIERPQTFINSHCKGLDNMWFFHLSGGVNRHIAGLTRVRNAHAVQKRLKENPEWATMIDTPRKWFWLPRHTPWIEITGTNIGTKPTVNARIPGTYAIVADAINAEKQLSLSNSNDDYGQMAMRLCNFLEMRQDPHVDNFMIEKETKKFVIIDTENFASTVGIKKPITFKNYFSWYRFLATKCIKDWFFRTKAERYAAQQTTNTLALKQLDLA